MFDELEVLLVIPWVPEVISFTTQLVVAERLLVCVHSSGCIGVRSRTSVILSILAKIEATNIESNIKGDLSCSMNAVW